MPTSRMSGCSLFTRPGNQRDGLDEETTDWRAVCGKTARTVRRAGSARADPDPYHSGTCESKARATPASLTPANTLMDRAPRIQAGFYHLEAFRNGCPTLSASLRSPKMSSMTTFRPISQVSARRAATARHMRLACPARGRGPRRRALLPLHLQPQLPPQLLQPAPV